MIIDPNSPSWRERMEYEIQQVIINSGGVIPIQTDSSWKVRIEELLKILTYLIISGGDGGALNAAGGLVINSTATLSTTATQIALRNASGVLKVQTASNGVELTVATLEQPQTYLKAQRSAVVALVDAPAIEIDANLANLFTLTLGGNRTIGLPTNLQVGTNFEVLITQDATGSRTLTFNTSVCKFAGGTAPTLSTTAGMSDRLFCVSYDGSTLKCDLGKNY